MALQNEEMKEESVVPELECETLIDIRGRVKYW